jgi:hypothetical protein
MNNTGNINNMKMLLVNSLLLLGVVLHYFPILAEINEGKVLT